MQRAPFPYTIQTKRIMQTILKSSSRTALLAVVVATSACQAWKVENRPVEAVVADRGAGPVALTMNDRRWVVLRDPTIQRDSVIGTRIAGNTFGEGRTALSLHAVRGVETRRFSLIRTIGLAASTLLIPSLYRLAIVEND